MYDSMESTMLLLWASIEALPLKKHDSYTQKKHLQPRFSSICQLNCYSCLAVLSAFYLLFENLMVLHSNLYYYVCTIRIMQVLRMIQPMIMKGNQRLIKVITRTWHDMTMSFILLWLYSHYWNELCNSNNYWLQKFN